MNVLAKDLVEHYDRAFAMLQDLVDLISDERWKDERDPVAVPVRWAFHAASAAEFYTQYIGYEFDWSKLPNWEGPVEALPDRAAFLTYAKDVIAGIHERWASKTDEEMLSETGFDWTGYSKMAQLLYGLRHLTYHLGELSMIVRQAGASESPWR